MMRLLRQAKMAFGQAQPIPLSLPFPYQYTLACQEFTLHDIRFKELPFSREFAPPEKQHLVHTLTNFQQLLNTGNAPSLEHLQKSLIGRVKEVRSILAESDITLHFHLHTESLTKSQGYLQIKPVQGVPLQEADLKPINHYRLQRERESLTVHLRPQREKLSPQQQLKKDIADKMGQTSKEVREQLDKMRFSKEALFMNRFINKLLSLGKSEKKTKFEPYFIIDQIAGEMDCGMTHAGKQLGQWRVPFDSKWLYWVSNLESEDLKRHRKRTMFDFQYWNRGNFFPIRNYAAEVADLE